MTGEDWSRAGAEFYLRSETRHQEKQGYNLITGRGHGVYRARGGGAVGVDERVERRLEGC